MLFRIWLDAPTVVILQSSLRNFYWNFNYTLSVQNSCVVLIKPNCVRNFWRKLFLAGCLKIHHAFLKSLVISKYIRLFFVLIAFPKANCDFFLSKFAHATSLATCVFQCSFTQFLKLLHKHKLLQDAGAALFVFKILCFETNCLCEILIASVIMYINYWAILCLTYFCWKKCLTRILLGKTYCTTKTSCLN